MLLCTIYFMDTYTTMHVTNNRSFYFIFVVSSIAPHHRHTSLSFSLAMVQEPGGAGPVIPATPPGPSFKCTPPLLPLLFLTCQIWNSNCIHQRYILAVGLEWLEGIFKQGKRCRCVSTERAATRFPTRRFVNTTRN